MTNRVGLAEREADVRLSVASLDALGPVSREFVARRVEILALSTTKNDDRYDVTLHLRLPTELVRQDLLAAIDHLDGVEIIEAVSAPEH